MKRAILLFLLSAATVVVADENAWLVPLGQPPKATPRRISGGEAMPPLPLPATPLRRSERKRQPSPPKLMGKVVWGETAMFAYENGSKAKVADWNQCPSDLQQLLQRTGRGSGMNYGTQPISLASFHGDPEKMPVLLFSGSRSIRFDDSQIEILRRYMFSGGMIMFDSIAGSPYFYESAQDVTRQIAPGFQIREIPADHPIYHMLHDVEKVRYPKNNPSDKPELEGIYVGCRIGALISKYGLGCGWDGHEVPLLKQAVYYDVESATKIGMNLVAYSIGYAHVGREEAKPELFGALDEKDPTDEFVFAQIKHEGTWNVHPGGASSLLRRMRQNTALRVSLKRVPVTLGKDDISSFTFLYLTGLDDFHLSGTAREALKHFLNNSGTLLINNGLGLRTFDAAVRRELKHMLPDSALTPLPATHPIYSSVFRIDEAAYTPAVMREKPNLIAPYLEGIAIHGDVRVIYSPYDMEAAWQGCEHPLARAYESHSGMQLGINVIMYAMTH